MSISTRTRKSDTSSMAKVSLMLEVLTMTGSLNPVHDSLDVAAHETSDTTRGSWSKADFAISLDRPIGHANGTFSLGSESGWGRVTFWFCQPVNLSSLCQLRTWAWGANAENILGIFHRFTTDNNNVSHGQRRSAQTANVFNHSTSRPWDSSKMVRSQWSGDTESRLTDPWKNPNGRRWKGNLHLTTIYTGKSIYRQD